MPKNKTRKTSPKPVEVPAGLRWLRRHAVWLFPVLLLLLAGAVYGLFVRQMGFYWDEWAYVWISRKLGDAGLQRYFATNRPFWGAIYRLTLPLIGSEPWRWQVFAIFWRWLNALLVAGIIAQTWRNRREVAAAAALLFLVYPGFDMQAIGLMFGHFFVVMAFFLGSLCLMLAAQRRENGAALVLTVLAMLAGQIQLLAMEYFFVLDLVRLPLLWVVAGQSTPSPAKQVKKTLLGWLPYALVWGGTLVWRTFFFQYQTQNYKPVLLNALLTQPLETLSSLVLTVLGDLYKVALAAWGQAVRPLDMDLLGKSGLAAAAGAGLLALVGVVTWFYWVRPAGESDRVSTRQMVWVALIALLLGGAPFWLTGLPVGLTYQTSRFTLPFTLGACLLAASLIWILPGRRELRFAFLAALVTLAAVYQVQVLQDFRRDWNQQKTFFWQLSWRAPALKPGSAVVINDVPMTFVSDNSLSAPLNDIYFPDNASTRMDSMVYFASLRGAKYFNNFQPGSAIEHNYLAAVFYGTSADMLAVNFEPPACLNVLDPDVDPANALLAGPIRSAAGLSDWERILPAPQRSPDPALFGPEPSHGWCYYFEKASLARQMGDWAEAARLGDESRSVNDYPNGPTERLPFIEAYAHLQRWDEALQWSRETEGISPVTTPPLCRLWARIQAETPASAERSAALETLNTFLTCQ